MLDRMTIIRSVDAKSSNHEPNAVFQTGNLEAAPRINPEERFALFVEYFGRPPWSEESRQIVELGELDCGLGGKLAVELGVVLELIDHRTHQRLQFGEAQALKFDRRAAFGHERGLLRFAGNDN